MGEQMGMGNQISNSRHPNWLRRLPMRAGLCGVAILIVCLLPNLRPLRAQIFPTAGQVAAHVTAKPPILHAGQSGSLIVTLIITPGFHVQSHKPFDPNLVPAVLTVRPAVGITFGKVVYPRPLNIPASKIITPLGKLSVYEGTVHLRVPFHVATTAAAGDQKLHLHIQTQACNKDSCFIPQNQPLEVKLTILAARAIPTKPATSHLKTPPTPAGSAKSHPIIPAAGGHSASGKSPPAPVQSSALGTARSPAMIHSRTYRPANQSHLPLWALIGFALLGGLILNIMPCVLPVIPLKVMAMVQQAHGSRRQSLQHAFAFTGGVLTLFIFIALLLGAQRAAGATGFFYGEQFQHSGFVIAMAVIVALLALSMLGVWTFALPRAVYNIEAKSGGYFGSFTMGLLATILATPCSAPFLGVMIAWALSEPILIIVMFFALVGVGMAAPYILLAAFPGAVSRLPRTGRWAELIKQGLGLITVGVAIYLLGTLPDRHLIILGAFITLIACISAWMWGQWPTYDMPVARIRFIRFAAVVFAIVASLGVYQFLRASVQSKRWQNFSVPRMNHALKDGHQVVVDFTANWCVNCKLVKATVLDSAAVSKAFATDHAVLLRADLTANNPVAQGLLVKLGGRSIPFLAIFSPHHPHRPVVLRDLYSIADVLKALKYR